jgi:hypothetical protein
VVKLCSTLQDVLPPKEGFGWDSTAGIPPDSANLVGVDHELADDFRESTGHINRISLKVLFTVSFDAPNRHFEILGFSIDIESPQNILDSAWKQERQEILQNIETNCQEESDLV